MTDEKEVFPMLAVGQLITDLQTLPAEAEVFVAVLGAGITIPIVGLSKFTTNDAKEIIVFSILAVNAAKAIDMYSENLMKQSREEVPH